jgi:Fur family ferric uptake transcriptional regulator
MEFCDPRLLEIQRSIEEQLGVEITHHSLIFYGHKKS